MKKFLLIGAGVGFLQLINCEVFSALVLLALAAYGFVKFFPIFMEGTK